MSRPSSTPPAPTPSASVQGGLWEATLTSDRKATGPARLGVRGEREQEVKVPPACAC